MKEMIVGRPAGAARRRLWLQAKAAAGLAYAPYSGLRVGAALVTAAGATFTGVNVENASYPVGQCAERAALAAAVTAGERRFAALAVATASGAPILPCGACLQAFAEFGEIEVVALSPAAGDETQRSPAGELVELRVVTLGDLLRAPFRLARDAP
jgi:cytidine deaminase